MRNDYDHAIFNTQQPPLALYRRAAESLVFIIILLAAPRTRTRLQSRVLLDVHRRSSTPLSKLEGHLSTFAVHRSVRASFQRILYEGQQKMPSPCRLGEKSL